MAPVTDLDARYGRRRPMSRRSRTTLVVAGILLAVIAVVAFYFWWASAQDPFGAQIRSFDVVSDARVDVSVEVTNDSDGPVRCEVVAQDRYTQVVGTTVIQTTEPGPRVQVLVTQVPTTARAVVATVGTCAAAATRVP
jgi:Domain of unknown function (DUF4307)